MFPLKFIEAVQRRAVLLRLMQDARVVYAPTDNSTPKEFIECGDLVPVAHSTVPTTVVLDVVGMLSQLVQVEDEKIAEFSMVERPQTKIPKMKEPEDARRPEGDDTSTRKKPLRGGKVSGDRG